MRRIVLLFCFVWWPCQLMAQSQDSVVQAEAVMHEFMRTL